MNWWFLLKVSFHVNISNIEKYTIEGIISWEWIEGDEEEALKIQVVLRARTRNGSDIESAEKTIDELANAGKFSLIDGAAVTIEARL